MKTKILREKTSEELDKELLEKAIALNDFKFKTSGSKIKNVKIKKNLKRDIAQIFTILNEKSYKV
ncbi:MAG: 50S ribosomal protein L29 [bacterium]